MESEYFFSATPVNNQQKDYLPLWEAMFDNHLEIVELFLGLGADPDKQCENENCTEQCTPLQYVANLNYSPKYQQLAEVLVRCGAEVSNSHTLDTGSPLFIAITRGNLELVEMFLKNGAKFEGRSWEDISPVQVAFHIEYDLECKGMLQLLFRHGVDPQFKNMDGENLLHLFMGTTDIFEEIGGDLVPEIAEILLDNGVPVDEPNADGDTPLHHAVCPPRGNYVDFDFELAKLFIKRGADVNKKSRSLGHYPLALAVMEGNKDLVNLLLDNGAEIHAKEDDNGFTVLHIACMYHEQSSGKDIIELLIRRGADGRMKDNKGRTPFELVKIMQINNHLDSSNN